MPEARAMSMMSMLATPFRFSHLQDCGRGVAIPALTVVRSLYADGTEFTGQHYFHFSGNKAGSTAVLQVNRVVWPAG